MPPPPPPPEEFTLDDPAGSSAAGGGACPLAGSITLALTQATDASGAYALCFPSVGITVGGDACELRLFALGSSGLAYDGQPCPVGPLAGGAVAGPGDLPAAIARALGTPSFGPGALSSVQVAGAGGIRVVLAGARTLFYSVDMVSGEAPRTDFVGCR